MRGSPAENKGVLKVEKTKGSEKQYLWHRYTPVHLKEIGEQFKISESAASHAVSRDSKTIAKDKKVRKKIDQLINRLKHS